ncbi:MAG TPA: alpha-amylase family glycosyl hydrolase, partial [Thermoanaerobaculia bacterium]|nr:alpha-amylase family glycosyl hydrolase [Thermoanaerobaculia bacterium]
MPPSERTGMGAVPYHGGVTFRVWSPFARSIHVAGSFNDWSTSEHALARESDARDYWSADVDGAKISDEYQFVLIGANGEELWRIDPYAREVTNSTGNGVIAETDFAWSDMHFVCPDRRELVIYELHVGTFAGDEARGDRRGTFDTVLRKLPYLQDLGVSAILLTASGEFPTDVSLGYNPAHIFAIESSYGGPNGFRALVDAANQRGIAVILDVVYNHFGPSDLDLWNFDGWHADGGDGGIYFYNEDWKRETPWGPRPDYGRAEVRRYIRDNAMRWIDSRGADGLRWDMTAFIRNWNGRNNDPAGDIADGWSLMQEINAEIADVAPNAIRMAEDMQDNEWITKAAAAGGAGFNTQWSAKFVHTLRRAVIADEDQHRNLREVADAIEQQYAGDAFARTIYTESHDEVRNGRARVPYEVDPQDAGGWLARKRSTLGAAMALTAPGIPMLFQGQEFAEDGWFEAERMLDWRKLDRFPGIHAMYRDLIRLRRNWFDHTRGLRGDHVWCHHVNDGDKVLAYLRWGFAEPRDETVVLANFANRVYGAYRIGVPRAGLWRVRFNSDWQGYSADFGNAPSFDAQAEGMGLDGMAF